MFVFGDLNYRVDPGVIESSPRSNLRVSKVGWGGRWKKSNDAPSGSLVAAVAGLAAKTEKTRNARSAWSAAAAASDFEAPRGDRPALHLLGPQDPSTDPHTDAQPPNPSTPRPNPKQPPAHTHPPHQTQIPQSRENPS